MSFPAQIVIHALRVASVLGVLAGRPPALHAQADFKGSSDHPLFPTRMPGYRISSYKQEAFASFKFRTKPPQAQEGKLTKIGYFLTDTAANPGVLAITRNYENAIKAAGGEVVYSTSGLSVLRATYDGTVVWAQIQATAGRHYDLYIIEVQPMVQVITADAMAAAIEKDGFVALDIHFATGKAEILPESLPIVDQIVALLKGRPTWKVGVEGHTDNTGTPTGNATLSQARAQSVVDAIVAGGIAAERVKPVGYGQEQPVADNRTEEGRAKNRRVEVVKLK